jgi:Na+/H+-dicarboxylate symporter
MPFALIAIIFIIIMLEPLLPLEAKSIIYATAQSIKSIIIFLLPAVIFSLLFKAVMTLSSRATSAIIAILLAICASNFLSTSISGMIGSLIYQFDLSLMLPQENQGLVAYWQFSLPSLVATSHAMFAGIVLGLLVPRLHITFAMQMSELLEKMVGKILLLFAWLIPAFVAGFIMKLQADGVVITIVKDYSLIFMLVALTQFSYILLIYLLAKSFNLRKTMAALRAMLPAAITGFSTMSSMASMPLTIIGVEKNTNHSEIAKSVVPATVNIHLIGDCFAIPIFAFAILKNYDFADPAITQYMCFAFYFVLAKFSVAAMPGGGIIVMLPILETYLGFNSAMVSLITALYILFDPVITCANVLGNGGFAMICDRVQKLYK